MQSYSNVALTLFQQSGSVGGTERIEQALKDAFEEGKKEASVRAERIAYSIGYATGYAQGCKDCGQALF
jgi:flagellar biosynthesis/type III secretory pathway protein FliH